MEIAKLGALLAVCGVFLYGLHRKWEGVYLVFGIVFLMGSCQMIGVK